MSRAVDHRPGVGSFAQRLVRLARIAGLVATLTGLLAVAPTAAAARECRHADLEPQFPRYGRVGQNIRIQALEYQSEDNEYTGTVEVTPAGSKETLSYPLELHDTQKTSWGGRESTILVPAGKRSRETKFTIHWLEREIPLYDGWPSLHECESMAVATIPVVPPGGTVGDPSVARLSGRFRILYRVTASGVPDVKKADHATWKLRPLCRYFGCFTKVRSSLGMRGNFWIPSNGRHDYELNWSAGSSARFGSCEGTWVNRFTGEVVGHWKIRHAFHEDLDIALDTVEEPETHRVKSFSGMIVRHYEPIRSAKRRGCHDAYIKERVRGQLIR